MALLQRYPFPLSERLTSTAGAIFSAQGRETDVAVAGIPFLLATTPDMPRTVETIPLRKDQFDAEQDVGEQSLGGWWRRSQDSFHEGAGNLYQENRLNSNPSSGFYDSMGVDVFTKGQFTLIREMAEVGTGTFSRIRSAGTSGLSAVSSGKLATAATKAGPLSDLHSPATKTIVDGFVSGANFYDVASDGSLYAGTVASPGTATTWPLGSACTRMEWGKHRLWVIGGNKIWQPDLSSAGGTAQTPIFTNPNAGWTYTCITEGPAAMYFGGHDGRVSSIQAVALSDDGALPTVSGAQVTAVLPDGELVQELACLAGEFIGIGTNRGFRVGVLNGTTLTYGPLLITPPGVTGCTAMTTLGRFFLVAFSTAGEPAVAYKVDTGTEISEGVFAYAKDVYVGATDATGSLTSLATSGEDVLATDASGSWYAQGEDLVETGWLLTGRIRFRTNERKLFKYLDLEVEPMHGALAVTALNEVGSSLDVGTFGTAGEGTVPTMVISSALGPQRQMSLKFTLSRDAGDTTAGPVINSYLMRAVPSVAPQRLHVLPLLCFDKEQAKSGQRYGYQGYAAERLAALQALEDVGDMVVFQDFTAGGAASGVSTVIDGIRFVQTNASPGFGGILVLQLRTVTS